MVRSKILCLRWWQDLLERYRCESYCQHCRVQQKVQGWNPQTTPSAFSLSLTGVQGRTALPNQYRKVVRICDPDQIPSRYCYAGLSRKSRPHDRRLLSPQQIKKIESAVNTCMRPNSSLGLLQSSQCTK